VNHSDSRGIKGVHLLCVQSICRCSEHGFDSRFALDRRQARKPDKPKIRREHEFADADGTVIRSLHPFAGLERRSSAGRKTRLRLCAPQDRPRHLPSSLSSIVSIMFPVAFLLFECESLYAHVACIFVAMSRRKMQSPTTSGNEVSQ